MREYILAALTNIQETEFGFSAQFTDPKTAITYNKRFDFGDVVSGILSLEKKEDFAHRVGKHYQLIIDNGMFRYINRVDPNTGKSRYFQATNPPKEKFNEKFYALSMEDKDLILDLIDRLSGGAS